MPQAASRSSTPKTAMPKTVSASLNSLLGLTWRAYAQHRPEYELRCEKKNERLYYALKQSKAPRTPNLEEWLAIDALVTTQLDEVADKRDEQNFDQVCRVLDQIKEAKCGSLSDLATLANACAVSNSDLWAEPLEDLDWGKDFVRRLVEAVLTVAGEQNVLAGLPLPKPVAQDAMRRVAQEQDFLGA